MWISDIPLGTRGCNAKLLLDFLRSIECDTLYLVGDILTALGGTAVVSPSLPRMAVPA